MKVKFHFDGARCMACGACAVACMDQNDTDLAAGQLPLRRVYVHEEAGRRSFHSDTCLHCENAPCAAACPSGALEQDAQTGLVLLHAERCVGCRRCAAVCPHDVPRFERQGERWRMVKCDGCAERLRAGFEPACVRACPVGALSCRTEE